MVNHIIWIYAYLHSWHILKIVNLFHLVLFLVVNSGKLHYAKLCQVLPISAKKKLTESLTNNLLANDTLNNQVQVS